MRDSREACSPFSPNLHLLWSAFGVHPSARIRQSSNMLHKKQWQNDTGHANVKVSAWSSHLSLTAQSVNVGCVYLNRLQEVIVRRPGFGSQAECYEESSRPQDGQSAHVDGLINRSRLGALWGKQVASTFALRKLGHVFTHRELISVYLP